MKEMKSELSHREDNATNNNTKVIQSNKNPPSSPWITYKDVMVHHSLFKKGLVVIKPKHIQNFVIGQTKSVFINDREFFFYYPKKTGNFTDKVPHTTSTNRAKKLLSELKKFVLSQNPSAISSDKNSLVLFNPKRREEIFLPLILNGKASADKMGLYLYPWLTKHNNKFKFSGFSQYVTAGCLFGSNLKGMDQHGSSFALIKHDIEFFPGQKIEFIIYDPDASNPYEQMLFSEFKKLANIIDILSKPQQPKHLLYHLPYYDYALFGVELFIRGRITLSALNTLINIIFEKKDEYIKKINDICNTHGIIVEIESPFENLFGTLDKQENITQVILDILQLPSTETHPDISMDKQKENETALVQSSLSKLQSNSFKKKHCQVWQDFASIDSNKITNLEELFKIANAVMLAVACSEKNNYETCSLLPLSEKQIQVNYDALCKTQIKKHDKKQKIYSAAFNITIFDPLITYSPTTKGLPFYFGLCQETLSKLILDKEILQRSYQNVGFFANKVTLRELKAKEQIIKPNSQEELTTSIDLQKVLSG